ncbi:MAG TPA: class I SAM-dependent methyltransferase [Candidatus Binataceae bacterium]|nr:class I SAM-dependent methyltransferase [Candidatus Binataceae bacterium]
MEEPDHFRELIYDNYNVHSDATPVHRLLTLRAPFLKSVVSRHFPPDREARVLELGCGYGGLLYFARQAGYRQLRGIDRSPSQIELARSIEMGDVVELGDAMELLAGLPDSSLDAMVALDLIEHLRRDELLELAAQVARTLRPGGRWIINTVNAESPFFGRIRYGDFTHEQAFTRGSIGQLLTISGFGNVQCFEGRVIVHGLKSAVRRVLWEFFRAFASLWMLAECGTARGLILSQCFMVVAEKPR